MGQTSPSPLQICYPGTKPDVASTGAMTNTDLILVPIRHSMAAFRYFFTLKRVGDVGFIPPASLRVYWLSARQNPTESHLIST